MKKKTIVRSIESDIYELIAESEKTNEVFSQGKITLKRYNMLRYVYACRAQYLLRVVELAKQYNISFDLPVYISKLPSEMSVPELNLESVVRFMAEDLSEDVDIKSLGRIVGLRDKLTALSDKYSILLPEEELIID